MPKKPQNRQNLSFATISLGFFIITLLNISSGNTSELNKDILKIIVTRGHAQYVMDPVYFEEFLFQSQDKLHVIPRALAQSLVKTPDGHLHIQSIEGNSIRIPPEMILTPHKGYLIPEHLCLLTGAGSETLEAIGSKHVANYSKYMGLWPEMTFLELGCGIGRDVFQLLNLLNDQGNYIGIDVTRDSIAWLQKNITSTHSNFKFYHFDAQHELYNPLGSKTSFDFSLPVADHSVDRICAGSVFTHLFKDEIVHYLKEIKRVLKSGGLAYATFFLYFEEAIAASRAKSTTPFNLRFEHPFGEGCFINDPHYKTGAVAYTYETLIHMMNEAGLKLACPLIKGSWSGFYSDCDDGQEVAIFTNAD